MQARSIQCPYVTLTYVNGASGAEVRVFSVPTSNETLFRFPAPVTRKPQVYTTVRQLVKSWPLVVTARSDHDDQHAGFVRVHAVITIDTGLLE